MTIALIDTFGFFFRSFYAMPKLSSPDGFPTGLLTGFLNFINALMRSNEADCVLFCLEGRGEGFREKLYPEYKGQRPDAPQEFKMQLPIAIEWIEKMGFAHMSIDGYEADDIIASVSKIAKQNGVSVQIISHDKDLYQLIDDGKISVWDPTKKTHVGTHECYEKFGVYPKDFVDFQALIGDSVDNVPGVRGIGPKTAAKLINEFKTLEAIYNAEHSGRTGELLAAGKESAILSKELVKLKDDLFDTLDFNKFTMPTGNIFENIATDLSKYNIRAVLKKNENAPKPKEAQTKEFSAILLDNDDALLNLVDSISADAVALDTETNSLDAKNAKLVGFSFAFNENDGYYVPLAHSYLGVGNQVSSEAAKKALLKLLDKKVVAHNYKFDSAVLENFLGIELKDCYFDTMIAAWLCNPSELVGLDYQAKKHFNHEMIAYSDAVKKGENFSSVAIEDASKYAAEDAWMTYKLYVHFNKELADLKEEFLSVEVPFISTLKRMEEKGVKVDLGALDSLKSKVNSMSEAKKNEIYSLAGTEFNINSPKQLQVILFTELGLNSGKKTKTGFSTDEATLDKMRDEHPIIDAILDFRELFKLQSTYITPLLELGAKHKQNRIFSSFLQTGTATGRLSSKNPNLQNIPVKGSLAKDLRSCFVAPENKALISIDYSQIELRLLAHFSKDPTLTNAFLNNEDIHLATATKIFGAEKAVEKRSFAKTINFGLLYGMGVQKLSATLNISTKEAKELIEGYFEGFPTVKAYLEEIKEQARIDGYSKTLLGRKRYFGFSGSNARDLATYEREAVNTVFQGSAADLIKLSMNKIDSIILNEKLNANMILQIHDELVFEADIDVANNIGKRFANEMQNIYTLQVPLIADMAIGQNWGEL